MKRLEAIDQFRGFAIFLMILANYMNNVIVIPSWLKHTDEIGYTLIDLIAPMFVFTWDWPMDFPCPFMLGALSWVEHY